MGKKRARKAYTSKGERRAVALETVKLVKRGVSEAEKALNRLRAWKKGRDPWITVPNSNRNETNRPFIRVRANALYGDPKGKRSEWSEE